MKNSKKKYLVIIKKKDETVSKIKELDMKEFARNLRKKE